MKTVFIFYLIFFSKESIIIFVNVDGYRFGLQTMYVWQFYGVWAKAQTRNVDKNLIVSSSTVTYFSA